MRTVRFLGANKRVPSRIDDDAFDGVEILVVLPLKNEPMAVDRVSPKRALEIADKISQAARLALLAGVPYEGR